MRDRGRSRSAEEFAEPRSQGRELSKTFVFSESLQQGTYHSRKETGMSKFDKERREVLKSTCILVGATALYTIGGSVKVFAAGGRGAQPQPLGAPERHDSFVYFDSPKKGQDVMTADIVLDAPPITVQAKDPELKRFAIARRPWFWSIAPRRTRLPPTSGATHGTALLLTRRCAPIRAATSRTGMRARSCSSALAIINVPLIL